MTIVNAQSIDEALEALDRQPGSLLIQGGTDTMVSVNFGRTRPEHVVSLRRVSELRGWHRETNGEVFIGAGLPYSAMEDGPLATLFPALAQAARTVGSPQIRAAGSIGGNLGTCSPAGDALPVLAALDAQVELRSLHTTRMVAFSDFMIGPKRSVLKPNELILGVRMRPLDGFQGYAKVGVRNAMVISVASVCLAVDASARSIRLALGSVGPTIIRCSRAERLASAGLANSASWHVPEDLARRVAETAADESSPIDDHRSTAAYRRHAVAVLTRRLLDRSSREQS